MHPIARVDIPAGGSVAFKPGGYHLMLMGLTSDARRRRDDRARPRLRARREGRRHRRRSGRADMAQRPAATLARGRDDAPRPGRLTRARAGGRAGAHPRGERAVRQPDAARRRIRRRCRSGALGLPVGAGRRRVISSTRTARRAAAIELTDATDRPFSLASLRGAPAFVFFGYTHCPDVCPATIGTVGEAIDAFGSGARAVFVSVDPERDTTAWLREYVRYMPAGFTALTGTERARSGRRPTPGASATRRSRPASRRRLLDVAHGRRLPRRRGRDAARHVPVRDVVRGDDGGRSVSWPRHRSRRLRVATPAAADAVSPPTPSSAASAAPSAGIATDRARRRGRLELGLGRVRRARSSCACPSPAPRIDDATIQPERPARVHRPATGRRDRSTAVAVQPPGVADVSYVADLAIPIPGPWRLAVTRRPSAGRRADRVPRPLDALDPGATAALGAAGADRPDPDARPTSAGSSAAVTTDPAPDLRLSQTSTTDALGRRPAVRARRRLDPVPGLAGLRPGDRHGPLPARPMARRRVHPPRAVPLRGRRRTRRSSRARSRHRR